MEFQVLFSFLCSISFNLLLVHLLQLPLPTSAGLQTLQVKSVSGQVEEIYSNVKRLADVSKLVARGEDLYEICGVNNSIWVVHDDPNYSESSTSFVFRILESTSHENCGPAGPETSARHLGNLDTNVSSISLFRSVDFQGMELYFSGDRLDLPIPTHFGSYGFTGPDSWELFDEVGPRQPENKICLSRPDGEDVLQPWRIPSRHWKVKRVVRGCGTWAPGAGEAQMSFQGGRSTHPRGDMKFDGAELRLTEPYRFFFMTKSWNAEWQVFSGRNFDGDSYCLDRFSMSWEQGIRIGSIKQGCGHPVGAELEELPEAYRAVQDSGAGILHHSLIALIVALSSSVWACRALC